MNQTMNVKIELKNAFSNPTLSKNNNSKKKIKKKI